MPLPLIYHDDYSAELPSEHRFPMDRFRLLRDHLVDSGLTRDDDLLRPQLCPPEILDDYVSSRADAVEHLGQFSISTNTPTPQPTL